MKEIGQQELIELFKTLIDDKELENEKLSITIHSGILPILSALKTNIHLYFKKREDGNYQTDSNATQMELIGRLNTDLRAIMQNLKPALLKDFGLLSTFENHANKLNNEKAIHIVFKNDTPTLKNLFSYQEELNIFRTYDLLINFLLLNSKPEKITVFLNTIENYLYIEFVCGKSKKDNTDDIARFSGADFKKIQARLLLLNAQFGANSDWHNFVQLIIPI